MEQAYFKPSETINVMATGLTAGLSLPSLFPGTTIDINGEFGVRGKKEDLLVQDVFYKLSLTINFGERWFVKRRLR